MAVSPSFPTAYSAITEKLDSINPVQYARTRNYSNGAVTCLSPYLSRGVISTRQVLQHLVAKGFALSTLETFVKELAWRDYFQRVAQYKNINEEIRQPQAPISNYEIPVNIINATTGIEGVDQAIEILYQTGYMHNHCRMYTAALVCNVAKSHWHHPAQWMYYHLLDGDWASNACSWQWVAGSNSSKKYWANQENINRYTHTNQKNTFLDTSYEELVVAKIPNELTASQNFDLPLYLPESSLLSFHPQVPTYIYNYYNMDPLWHRDEPGNRVLLLEPEFFAKYPIHKHCFDFLLALCENIAGIQVYVGSFSALADRLQGSPIYYKEHPFNRHYTGVREEREWMVPEVADYYPSFSVYWKKIEKHLKQKVKLS